MDAAREPGLTRRGLPIERVAEGEPPSAPKDAWVGEASRSPDDPDATRITQQNVLGVVELESAPYKALTGEKLLSVPQLVERTTPDQRRSMLAVSKVLPMRNNLYVVDELIRWDDPNDPMLRLTFPNPEMLPRYDLDRVLAEMDGVDQAETRQEKIAAQARLNRLVMEIRESMNPHPAGQRELNVPWFRGKPLEGVQHKYGATVLIFPDHGQTCHSICTYCFRFPNLNPGPGFEMLPDVQFATRDMDAVSGYIREQLEVTNALLTGGDPLIMGSSRLRQYVEPLLKLPNVETVRIGTKALSYWPQRFVTDPDASDLLKLFEEVVRSGRQLAIQAHYSHPRELELPIAQEAVRRVRATGAIIRSQAPLIRGVNDDPEVWASMWRMQLRLGIVPYYMFIERDTGPQDFFGIPLTRAHEIHSEAMNLVGGTCKAQLVGSWTPGKVELAGILELDGQKYFDLRFVQARNPEWNRKPFLAEHHETAMWFDQLRPRGGGEFFFERELRRMIDEENARRIEYEASPAVAQPQN